MKRPIPRNQNLSCPEPGCGKGGFNNIFALVGHTNWHKRRRRDTTNTNNKPKVINGPGSHVASIPPPAPTPPAKRPYIRKPTPAPEGVKYCPQCGCHIAVIAAAINFSKGA